MENNFELVRRLMIASNKLDGIYYLAARKLGVNENTLSFIYALGDGKPHSQKQICEEWLIPKTTINTIVKEMTEAGYVTLLAGEHTREKAIVLTDKGKKYVTDIIKNIYEAEQNAIKSTIQEYSPQFVEAFDFFAGRLYDEFQKQILNQSVLPKTTHY